MIRRELYIANTLVDTKDELNYPLTYAIADIVNPDQRKTDFSKTITLPGSKTNDKLFKFVFSVGYSIQTSGETNFNPDFNPNLKAEVVYFADGAEIFRGYAQMVEIRVLDDRSVEYDINIFGRTGNLFADIGDDLLKDVVDLSEYDHTYNLTNIQNSWTPTVGTGYTYPLIDYGFSSDLDNFDLINLYPATFIKTIWDKIFSYYGYTYDSTFLGTDKFKQLIMPFSSPYLQLTAAQIQQRLFRASRASTNQETQLHAIGGTTNHGGQAGVSTSVQTTNVVFNDDSTLPNFDNTGGYDTGTGIFTVQDEGNYSFTTQVKLQMRLVPNTGSAVYFMKKIRTYVELAKQDTSGAITVLNSTYVEYEHDVNQTITTSYTTVDPATLTGTNDNWTGFFFNPQNHLNLVVSNVPLNVGDKIVVRTRSFYYTPYTYGANLTSTQVFKDAGGTFYDGDIYIRVLTGSTIWDNISNPQILEGDTMIMNNTLPQTMRVKDFVMSIVKMFNLYLEPVRNTQNQLLIEPRNDYYGSTVRDWTKKLDNAQDVEVVPMGALDARVYRFKHKDDTDYYNVRYSDTYKETYGQRDVQVNNDFVKNTKVIETVFSPTPSVGNSSSNRIIPRIIKIDDNGVASGHQGNPRILIWGGLKTSNTGWNILDSNGVNTFTSYPYAGHWDDPFDPTYDINFGLPWEIYWEPHFDDINFTTNNLYNGYYKQGIEEVTDPNSKIVRGWFRLNPVDIHQLSFRDKYYFKDDYFRLQKIADFDPTVDELAYCEFLKIKAAVPFTSGTTAFTGALEADGTEVLIPISGNGDPSKDGNWGTRNGTAGVFGSDNRWADSSENLLIVGDFNTVGEGARNVTLFNVSGVNVYSGAENVTIINTQGPLRVTDSNSLIIGGKYVTGYRSTEVVTASRSKTADNFRADTYLCDTTSGDINISLINAADNEGTSYSFVKTNSGGGVINLIPSGTETINGSTSLTITAQWDSARIRASNSNWVVI